MPISRPTRSIHWIILTALPLLLLSVILLINQGAAASTQAPLAAADPAAPQTVLTETLTNTVFLPSLSKYYPLRTLYGIDMYNMPGPAALDLVVDAGSKWLRTGEVAWEAVQPEQGMEPDWSALARQEQAWITASERGFTNIVIVDTTPAWAQLVEGYSCGPMKPEYLDEFAEFVNKLVRRYRQPPYNIKYWEFWNEPDIAPSIVYVPNSGIGCWGDENDPYYGGEYYGEMLKHVYPAVKSADPYAKVLVGGLLLDCDPRHENTCADSYFGHGDKPPKFLRGILENDGAQNFDAVSFHAYDIYMNNLGQYANPRWDNYWNGTGPALLAKMDYINELLAEYNASDKMILNTENAVLWICDDDPTTVFPFECADPGTYETTKAYYLAQTFAAAIRDGLEANIWFSLFGWRESGLIEVNNTTLPAYDAFKFSSQQLAGARYVRDVTEYANVRAYEFWNYPNRIWVLWSLDGSARTITLPSAPTGGYHVDGTPLEPNLLNGTNLTVTLEPVYIDWSVLNR